MQDIFFMPKEKYNEPINPLQSYVKQLVFYIQKKTSLTREQALEKAKEILKKHFKDPRMKCFERLDNGDKIVKDTTLYQYIKSNLAAGNVLAPTLTTYMPRKLKKSMLSEFIAMAVSNRKVAKKAAQKAKAHKNMELFTAKNNEQNLLKIYANSMSGAFGLEACILFNPSNHSTLTSLVRTMTSLSNANNERLIAGNRYFPRPIDIYNNIIYIASHTQTEKIQTAVDKFNLYLPTVEDTVKVLKYSSDLYFFDQHYYNNKIIPLLQTFTPIELANICYAGDFYHLRKFNPGLVRHMLDELALRITAQDEIPEITSKIYTVSEDILNYVCCIFFDELKGRGKDYSDTQKIPLLLTSSIYLTAQHVVGTFAKYREFFSAFFMTNIIPNNSFRLGNMRRRTVVLSDTDSTCFTLDEWVRWYKKGEFVVEPQTVAISGALAFITTQSIVNLLLILSRNMNVDDDLLDKIGMKNEFLWLVHCPAEVSKHYYAYTVLQEGTVLGVPEYELKGVHLKNSALPKFVTEDGRRIMEDFLKAVANNEKIEFNKVVGEVIHLENVIRDSVMLGEPVFLKRSKIKAPDAYAKGPDQSPYQRHTFWNKVFGPKYGDWIEPPYGVLKLPTTIKTKTDLKNWIESIADPELKDRLTFWVTENKKGNLPTIYLNESYVVGSGIPEEIKSIIDIKRIILDVTLQHRIILETMGIMLYDELLVGEQLNV